MTKLSRREFLGLTGRAVLAIPFLTPADWSHLLANDNKVCYGFANDKIPVRRQARANISPVGFYGKTALLRYRQVEEDNNWLQIINDTNLLYPERELARGDLYIPRTSVTELNPSDLTPIAREVPPENKVIEVTLSRPQRLVAYEGLKVFLRSIITAGLYDMTPQGEFAVIWKTKARYMQGDDFDLPGVPFVAYFTNKGHALHGAYWRKTFGQPGSHGCINIPVPESNLLWRWVGKGTRVVIHD